MIWYVNKARACCREAGRVVERLDSLQTTYRLKSITARILSCLLDLTVWFNHRGSITEVPWDGFLFQRPWMSLQSLLLGCASGETQGEF